MKKRIQSWFRRRSNKSERKRRGSYASSTCSPSQSASTQLECEWDSNSPMKATPLSVSFNLEANIYHPGAELDADEIKSLWVPMRVLRLQQRPPSYQLAQWVENSIVPKYLVWRLYLLLCGEIVFLYYQRRFLEFTSVMLLCEQLWG